MLSISSLDLKNVNTDLMDQISTLHQKFFNLSRPEIKTHLRKRDMVYVFSKTDTQEVIGTVAVKWMEEKNSVIVYIGNVVIAKEYQRHNLLSHILFKVCLKTLLKFPGRKIYFSVFMSNPKVYNICKRFPHHFPSADHKTPQSVLSIMKKTMETIVGLDKTSFHNDYYLVHNFNKTAQNFGIEKDEKNIQSYNGYYEKINPHFEKGDQLLSVFPITPKTVWLAFKKSFMYAVQKKLNALNF